MLLPNGDRAIIPPAKLTGYLLSTSHPVGKSKAKFLRAAGFDETNVEYLEEALLTLGRHGEVRDEIATPHGTKYVIDGIIGSPLRGPVRVRTVWIIDAGSDRPRLVTAYPTEE